MAKAKSGGSRSFLRGRLANDVYSIGKDGAGKKQQVVRSLAESVANPQTIAQMRGRMIMSTVMQAVSGLSQLVDHSFDGFPNGQPSISEFIRRNYALVKADVAAHPASDNNFGLNLYQQKGVMAGHYLISDGKAVMPAVVSSNPEGAFGFFVDVATTGLTAKAVRDALAMGADDYITLVAVMSNHKVAFVRLSVSNSLADATEITAANFMQLFTLDNPFGLTLTALVVDEHWYIKAADADPNIYGMVSGVIFTESIDGGFRHSTSSLVGVGTYNYGADYALSTYPQGSQRFLNGGEL